MQNRVARQVNRKGWRRLVSSARPLWCGGAARTAAVLCEVSRVRAGGEHPRRGLLAGGARAGPRASAVAGQLGTQRTACALPPGLPVLAWSPQKLQAMPLVMQFGLGRRREGQGQLAFRSFRVRRPAAAPSGQGGWVRQGLDGPGGCLVPGSPEGNRLCRLRGARRARAWSEAAATLRTQARIRSTHGGARAGPRPMGLGGRLVCPPCSPPTSASSTRGDPACRPGAWSDGQGRRWAHPSQEGALTGGVRCPGWGCNTEGTASGGSLGEGPHPLAPELCPWHSGARPGGPSQVSTVQSGDSSRSARTTARSREPERRRTQVVGLGPQGQAAQGRASWCALAAATSARCR